MSAGAQLSTLSRALIDAGFREQVLSELAAHPALTPRHVIKHQADLQRRYRERYNPAILVVVLRVVRKGDKPLEFGTVRRTPERCAEWEQD